MIIVELSGGIGNQMFQYAAARCLASENNAPLKICLNRLNYNWLRTYALKPFSIDESFISLRAAKKLLKLNTYTTFSETPGGFNEIFFNQKENTFLRGYWQSWKYFKNHEELIKNDFHIKVKPNEKNEQLIREIDNSESISVHVRRGDYVTVEKSIRRYGGICGLDYYQKCINYINEKIKNPLFFIFSDDPDWAKQNLRLEYPAVYINHNTVRKHSKLENYYLYRNSLILFKHLIPDKSYEDLRLMSHCKHFIIANSSFSWWGAWLSKNKNKIVCAPSKWYNPTSDKIDFANREYYDLVPETWIKY